MEAGVHGNERGRYADSILFPRTTHLLKSFITYPGINFQEKQPLTQFVL